MRRFLKPQTLLLAGLLAGFLAVLSIPSLAQDEGRWVKQSLRSSCEWWETCPRHRNVWRYVRPRHIELRAPRVYGYYHEERSPQCRDLVVTVGEERYGRDRAKEAAEAMWMEAVRARYGTKWMDLRNSRGGTWECGRSSTGNRASEKAQELAGKFLEQCELKARPCRAELEQVNNKD